MSNAKHVTDKLSAYLDNELSKAERAQVETHLRTCAQCQRELESVRYTMHMVQELPAMRAPRSFTLSDRQAARARPVGWPVLALRGLTAMAALLLLLVVSADLFVVSRNAGSARSSAPAAALNAATPAPAIQESNQPATDQVKSAPTNAPAAASALQATPTATTQTTQPTARATPSTLSPRPAGAENSPTPSATPSATGSPTATPTPSPAATTTASPTPPALSASTLTRTPTVAPVQAPDSPQPNNTLGLRLIEGGLLGLLLFGISALIILRIISR